MATWLETHKAEVVEKLRQSSEPVRIGKNRRDAVYELSNTNQLKIIAIEPFYYLCERGTALTK